MDKFGRNYELRVMGNDRNTLVVKPPFTIEFDITRSVLPNANVCQFKIYNLNERNRNLLRFNLSNYNTYQPFELKAGYGDNLSTIFFGNISQGWSFRQGTEMITQVECYDGGFAYNNAYLEGAAFPKGTSLFTVVSSILGQLEKFHVKPGKIGEFSLDQDTGILRGSSYTGNPIEVLQQITGGSFFIDNGVAHILRNNEYIQTNLPIYIIDANSGLLNTPILEQSIARLELIFEPQIQIGHIIEVRSLTEKNFNGQFKVTGVKHRGMISEAVAGTCITFLEFSYGFDTLLGVA